jgi:hypothetical protein
MPRRAGTDALSLEQLPAARRLPLGAEAVWR